LIRQKIFPYLIRSFQKNAALIENYRKLLAQINEGGSADARRRHVEINKKMLVRDRLKALLDPGAPFMELGALAGWATDYGDLPAAGMVLGKRRTLEPKGWGVVVEESIVLGRRRT
jgi:3-methylcrotonyl-CoA carboxylase beta subunit